MEWIRTKDRKPKFNKNVLLYDPVGQMVVGCLIKHQNGLVEWFYDGVWTGVSGFTHWMPLPEPPKDFNKI